MENFSIMLRFLGLLALLAGLTGSALAGPSSIEIDSIKPPAEPRVLKVDSAGNIVDPECRLMANEIAQYIAQNRVSARVSRSAINRHTRDCNKLRETQYKQMEENRRKISEDRAREADEKAKDRESQHAACVEKCRDTCAAACPPATITGGTAASGVETATGACPVTCPSKEVCEKRCAK